MTVSPDFDPYEALGVSKEATLAEIKSSHRKLVLKCHPDKIKDESLRGEAQDQFQKVQQAYECLSDETSRAKYDNKVKLAELKREMASRGASFTRTTREYRDGRIYEERVPADARSSSEGFFEEEGRFTESPRPTSRKYEEYGARPRSRANTDEKRRSSKAAPSSSASSRRESTKTTRADRDRTRTKERRQQTYDKYDNRDKYVHVEVDSDSASDSDSSVYYIPVRRPTAEKRHRESRTKPTEPTRRSSKAHYRDDDDHYSDEHKHDKSDMQYFRAADYIRRSKENIPNISETERRHRSSRSPHDHDSAERSGRSRRSTRPPTSHHSSYEHLDHASPRTVPSMPTAATFPSPKASSSPRTSHRSSGHVRSESRNRRTEHVYYAEPSRTTKLRGERSDSGYASSSPTPEIPEVSPKASRYKGCEPVNVPPPLKHTRTFSPPRAERPTISRSTTYTYHPEPPSRSHHTESSSRRLFAEADPVDARIKLREARRAMDKPEVQYIRPTHGLHSGRRSSTYVK
ncbi:uncharacterized protein DSM5745_00632 [Aspergillus mulundensis]|uniref:J domain-containing protein n=1 Tax=Aspergillus mulundensis TaxID=1810919 RepID=A0A3D8T453_9EURO|nr:hypothetical protein DSM5745_00632 [Aspergillus mulundensis]RDW93310.1 hypothetical protein DSM5745_00632 [Aspergillus mulundensis]